MFTEERLTSALSAISAEPAPYLFDQLRAMYGGPDRFYHSGQHVAECLRALDQHSSLCERPSEVEVAVWFHDAVYDSRRPDNEEKSALLAVQVLSQLSVTPGPIDRIESMILATKSHLAQDRDTQLLLDIDLGILGQPPAVFARYDEAIRKEFAWVEEEQYRNGRAAVLRGFLERSRIYKTDTFYELYEDQARSNLELRLRELDA